MEQKNIQELVSRIVREQLTVSGDKGKEIQQVPTVTLKLAKKLLAAVEQEAARMGVAAVIAVADRGGRPVAVHCMDDAYIASYDIALNKAYTSAALKISTAQLKELAQPGGSLYGIQHTNQGQIVIFGGGIPILWKDQVLGGLGVSGGSEEQDSALAEFARVKVKEAVDLWQ